MLIDLKGNVGLVVGIANEHSMAYGCAKQFQSCGAELVITYQGEKAEPVAAILESQFGAFLSSIKPLGWSDLSVW